MREGRVLGQRGVAISWNRKVRGALRRAIRRLRRTLRPLRFAVRRVQGEWQALVSPPRGEDYIELFFRVHALLRPRTYLEIGVANGDSLSQTRPCTLALGVDPALNPAASGSGETKLFRVTSDEFFRDRDVRVELEGRSVAIAFIDGLHLYEQVLREFINVERFCSPRSVIFLHDCLPRDRETSGREPRREGFWTGDVWKVVPCLSRYRPDLAVQTLDVAPAGLAAVTNLDPSSTVLADLYDRLCDEFVPLDYEDLVVPRQNSSVNLICNYCNTFRRVLDPMGIPLRVWGCVLGRSE